IQLVGTKSNRAAIGAKIEVKFSVDGKDSQVVYRDINSGGSFGANPLRQTIGIGTADMIQEIKVHWPTTGETQIFSDVAPNQFYKIVEGQSGLEKLNIKSTSFKLAEE
ncbi:ASPIC/UnbV domain-containing protein, partial [bacterium]|nr:ASPIC/UnbV domain-containing protein [bacterium]